MTAVHIQRHPNGPRVFLAGYRLHHGVTGLAICGLCLAARRRRAALAALALVLHDAHDWKLWFRREALDKVLVDALESVEPLLAAT